MHRPMTIQLWWAMLALFITCLLLTVGSLIYANNVARKSVQQWCNVVVTLDDAYRQAPPQTPTGKKLAAEMHDLRVKLDCH